MLEKAYITNKNDSFCQKYGKIVVKGGGDSIDDEREHNPPHFHLELNNGNEIKIVIPSNQENDIVSLNDSLNVEMLNELRLWFDLKNLIFNKSNNYETLKIMWDILNNGDDNIEKFSDI